MAKKKESPARINKNKSPVKKTQTISKGDESMKKLNKKENE